jgi:hypothetical protein
MNIFPDRLKSVPLWMKVFFIHVPRSDDKYALLEQLRIQECDEGKYEDLIDAFWHPAMAFQQLLDRLEIFYPDQYLKEVEAMKTREIAYMVRTACTDDLAAHRNDGCYRTYEAAHSVLCLYGVQEEPEWVAFIQQYQEVQDHGIQEFHDKRVGL